MKSFWQYLRQRHQGSNRQNEFAPIIGLAPMDGVTDHPFRFIQKKYGQPDIIYTEFTSVEGLCHNAEKLLKEFIYDDSQRPIIAQVFGIEPAAFRQTAVLVAELGFDGIDINMGCPAKNVSHRGAGAALIKNPQLAQEIIRATQAGIEDWVNGKNVADCSDISPRIKQRIEQMKTGGMNSIQENGSASLRERQALPVSVKTRVGYDQPIVNDWLQTLLETQPAAIAIHGRTLKQAYGGEANWELIGRAVEIRDEFFGKKNIVSSTSSSPISTTSLILGNGDIDSHIDALSKIATYKVDGVLIGRASFGNPFVFQPQGEAKLAKARFQVALEHAHVYEKFAQDTCQEFNLNYSFLPMRKHLGWYIKSIDQAKEIRQELFHSESAADVKQMFSQYGLI